MNKWQPLVVAQTRRALFRQIHKIDVPVQPRSEGRTVQDCERAAIVRLLTGFGLEQMDLPVTLIQGEHPDLLLTTGAREIGIEHTEAIPPNVAHATVLRERGLGSDVYFVPHALPTDPRKSKRELHQEIVDDEAHDGWAGDSAEREWADAMLSTVQRKLLSVVKPGFRLHPENWLLIYDNWPLPHIDNMVAARYLLDRLSAPVFAAFDAIYIVNDRVGWEFGIEVFRIFNIPVRLRKNPPCWPRRR